MPSMNMMLPFACDNDDTYVFAMRFLRSVRIPDIDDIVVVAQRMYVRVEKIADTAQQVLRLVDPGIE